MVRRPPISTLFPYTTLFRSANSSINFSVTDTNSSRTSEAALWPSTYISPLSNSTPCIRKEDRKSGSAGMPRPNSYAVFCLKKKNDAGPPKQAAALRGKGRRHHLRELLLHPAQQSRLVSRPGRRRGDRLHDVVGEAVVLGRNVAPQRAEELFQPAARIGDSRELPFQPRKAGAHPGIVDRVQDLDLRAEIHIDVGGRDAGIGGDAGNRSIVVAVPAEEAMRGG